MKTIVTLMLTICTSVLAQTEDLNSIEVIEIFHAETPEQLETSLTDGYPMPWLEEILNDESIPEEDRYWLDCRVRAVIAQDLHLFFNEEGNPVHIDADWIRPGEDYWRENFIVNPVGEPFLYDSPDMPTNVISEPGYVVNRFGETIGQLAMAEDNIRLSRDGSIGVMGSDNRSLIDYEYPVSFNYACILYADGSFKEIDAPSSFSRDYAMSGDGNTIAVTSRLLPSESSATSERGAILWVLNRDGNVRFTYEISGRSSIDRPLVSATGKYIVALIDTNPEEVILFDGNTGEILERFDDLQGMEFFFTPNERYLCIYAGSPQTVTLYDYQNNTEIVSRESIHGDYSGLRFPNCDNEAEYLLVSAAMPLHRSYSAYLFNFALDDISITESTPQIAHISPEASFTVMQMNTIWQIGHQHRSLPLLVSRLAGGE